MTEHQARIISKQTNLRIDLEDITKKLEKFYSDLTLGDDKLLIESLDTEDFLDDVRYIRDVANNTVSLLKLFK